MQCAFIGLRIMREDVHVGRGITMSLRIVPPLLAFRWYCLFLLLMTLFGVDDAEQRACMGECHAMSVSIAHTGGASVFTTTHDDLTSMAWSDQQQRRMPAR